MARFALSAAVGIDRVNALRQRTMDKGQWTNMKKIILAGMVAIVATACNVTRTVTTRSEAWQKGDTSVVIQTKTIETYDATKKL